MVKVKNKFPSWKPVKLNEAVLACGVEGLVGIEELTDYNFENNELNTTRPKCEIQKRKRKQGLAIPMLKNKTDKIRKGIKKKPLNLKKKVVLRTKNTKGKNLVGHRSKDVNAEKNHDDFLYESTVNDEDSVHSSENEFNDENSSLSLLPWTSLFVPIPVARALIELGFNEPTEIQKLSIPAAIQGRRDILGAAETGSGKTLAFGIPMIHGILNNIEKETENNESEHSMSESDHEDMEQEGLGCVKVMNLGLHKKATNLKKTLWGLILTPTRELAVQVKNHLVAALKFTDIKVVVLVGGMSVEKQQRLLRRGPHIVVATPGRLWELISQGEPHLNNIEDIRYLAIDETDRMTEVNHFPELRSLLEKINTDPVKQKKRQNFVFSATLTLVHDLPLHVKLNGKKNKKKKPILSSDDKLKKLINLLGITNPKIIDVTRKTGTTELLTESSIVCSLTQKDYYLFYFLQRHPGRTLVFCNSISCVRRLASLLTLLGQRPLPIHANMIQKQRLKNLERFRDSPTGLLLATDVAARGLDIPLIEHVLHYQVPRTSETYVHRSGRTARANHEGLTLLLVETGEQKLYVRLMKTLNRDKELPRFPIVSNLMDAVKQRVNLAREIDKLQLEYKKAVSKHSWVQRAAEEMDLVLDEDEMPEKVSDRTSAVIKRQVSAKQKQLKSLLKQSLKSQSMSFKYSSMNVNTTSEDSLTSQSAIQAVRSSLSDKGIKRKRVPKPFKPKKKLSEKISH